MEAFVSELGWAFRAGTPLLHVETAEDERLIDATGRVAKRAGAEISLWSCTRGLELPLADGYRQLADAPDLPALLRHLVEGAAAGPRIVVALDAVSEDDLDAVTVRLLKDLAVDWEAVSRGDPPRMLILSGVGWTPPASLAGYLQTVGQPLPTREEIAAMLAGRQAITEIGLSPRRLADRAVGLTQMAIEGVVRRLATQTDDGKDVPAARRERQTTEAGPVSDETERRLLAVVDRVKREEVRRTRILEVIPPADRPIELGGFEGFRDWFARRRSFFQPPGDVEDPRGALRPRGVLLAGFPGCGKSLAARWIAQELGVPLVAMDLGQVQDRWVGSSEARMRLALRTLEAAAPVVLFIDEIEKGVAGAGTESTGVTTRIVGQLLTWMADHRLPVFMVATCNRVDLPPELTRAGRFDAVFLVLPPTAAERRSVLAAVSRELDLELPEDALRRATETTQEFSGAELRQLLVEAAYHAGIRRRTLTVADVDAGRSRVTPLADRQRGKELLQGYLRSRDEYLLAGAAR